MVRFYKSKVSKITLKKETRFPFSFGFNVFSHKDTIFVSDYGWGKLQDIMILENGGAMDIEDDNNEELTEES